LGAITVRIWWKIISLRWAQVIFGTGRASFGLAVKVLMVNDNVRYHGEEIPVDADPLDFGPSRRAS